MRSLMTAVMLAGALCAAATARAETVKLTTLEWCPYTCQAAPDGGATMALVRAAFAAAGHDLDAVFLVLLYLLGADPALATSRTTVAFHPAVLIEQTLHVAFAPTAEGRRWKEAFERGLLSLDVRRFQDTRIAAIFGTGPAAR